MTMNEDHLKRVHEAVDPLAFDSLRILVRISSHGGTGVLVELKHKDHDRIRSELFTERFLEDPDLTREYQIRDEILSAAGVLVHDVLTHNTREDTTP